MTKPIAGIPPCDARRAGRIASGGAAGRGRGPTVASASDAKRAGIQ